MSRITNPVFTILVVCLAEVLLPAGANASCGAIAISNSGRWFSTWDRSSCDDALSHVTSQCESQSEGNCNSGSSDDWVAAIRCVSFYSDGSTRQQWAIVGTGNDSKSAIRAAYDIGSQNFKKSECRLVALVEGDGAHLKLKD